MLFFNKHFFTCKSLNFFYKNILKKSFQNNSLPGDCVSERFSHVNDTSKEKFPLIFRPAFMIKTCVIPSSSWTKCTRSPLQPFLKTLSRLLGGLRRSPSFLLPSPLLQERSAVIKGSGQPATGYSRSNSRGGKSCAVLVSSDRSSSEFIQCETLGVYFCGSASNQDHNAAAPGQLLD